MTSSAKYPLLFSPYSGKRLKLKNRIIHLSMTTRRVISSRVTDEMMRYYENRARGGAAVVISEPLNMARIQNAAHKVTVWDEKNRDGLCRWAASIEQHDCRLLGQIQDSGRGRHERGRNPSAIGVSALPDDLSWTMPRVLRQSEIEAFIEDVADSSYLLELCGFSGVELSAGHGHLIHQFLSPWSNQRTDAFGGDFEGRLKFLSDLIAAIRSRCGAAFLVGVKLPGDDGLQGSIDVALAEKISSAVTARHDIDYVAFCMGTHGRTLDWHIPDMHWNRSTWMGTIERLKPSTNGVPVVGLGLITDPAEAEGHLECGRADLIGLGRPLVTDPAWPMKCRDGREAEIRYCVSCNTCWGQVADGQPMACDNNPRLARTDEVMFVPPRAASARRIAVIGAGVAGLEAAWTSAARGHAVTVFSRSADVGGKTRLHADLPGGESLSSVYDYQFLMAKKYGVKFELGVSASAEEIALHRPDHVVLATGATMVWPRHWPRDWQESGVVTDARATASHLVGLRTRQSGTAVLYDMDHTEGTYSLAVKLKQLFDQVVVVTPRERVAGDVPLVTALGIHRRINQLGIKVICYAEISDSSPLEEGVLRVSNIYGGQGEEIGNVALFTYSTPRAADDPLFDALTVAGHVVHRIGDCRQPRTLLAATSEGSEIGLLL